VVQSWASGDILARLSFEIIRGAGPVSPTNRTSATEAQAQAFFASNKTVIEQIGKPIKVTANVKPTREEARKKAKEESMPDDMMERYLDGIMKAPPSFMVQGSKLGGAAAGTGILMKEGDTIVEATFIMFERGTIRPSKWNLLTGTKQ
jgi:hypothetical protein